MHREPRLDAHAEAIKHASGALSIIVLGTAVPASPGSSSLAYGLATSSPHIHEHLPELLRNYATAIELARHPLMAKLPPHENIPPHSGCPE